MTVVSCGKVGHASGSERLVSARDMLCGNTGDDHCLVARKNTEIQQCINTKKKTIQKMNKTSLAEKFMFARKNTYNVHI